MTTRLAEMWKIVDPPSSRRARTRRICARTSSRSRRRRTCPPCTPPRGRGRRGRRGTRTPESAKRPSTTYLLFAEDCRARLKKTDPGLSFTETSQVVSREWKELTDAKKNAYIRTADKEQEKHRVAKANWEAKNMVSIPSAHAVPPPIPA